MNSAGFGVLSVPQTSEFLFIYSFTYLFIYLVIYLFILRLIVELLMMFVKLPVENIALDG
jgi:hypothetical protein